ncbi:hypothetical protein [Bradyrhizobium sp. CCGB20]|uniref:hypothetical protein n=1 Tax=Bradyrhizobium sp. CCGB20 TaxID=2949633 RepID=UPI0020B31D5A|nr:hypothetical protein [Bradyrhizobium sp. CCGB20]MCP3397330.1 hypothetical protein [Bradyrhizobium sp. CCGB20]
MDRDSLQDIQRADLFAIPVGDEDRKATSFEDYSAYYDPAILTDSKTHELSALPPQYVLRRPPSAYHRVIPVVANSTRLLRGRWRKCVVGRRHARPIALDARNAGTNALLGASIAGVVLARLERCARDCGDDQSGQQGLEQHRPDGISEWCHRGYSFSIG